MYEYDREKDRLIIKLEAAEKAYMSLLYDYTELKAEKEKIESALKEVKDLLDYLISHNYASKNSEKKEDEGWKYRVPEWINRTPRMPEPGDFTYYTDKPTIVLCWSSTMKSWSIKLSCADDTDDVTAEWNDEDDGWEDEETWGAKFHCKASRRRGCKRARGCRSAEWRQHSKLQQRDGRGLRWDNK